MKYLGVDFGLKRVGFARSNGELSSPWKVIEGKGVVSLTEKIRLEAADFEKIVIGVPEGKMGKLVKKVIGQLKAEGFNVIESDETLSSQNATKLMVDLGLSKKKRKTNDAYSAAEILQNYLDNQKHLTATL